jgi:uncharacterized iron-regulated protein
MFAALLLLVLPTQAAVFDFDRLSNQDFIKILQQGPAPAPLPAPVPNSTQETIFERDGALISPDDLAIKLQHDQAVYVGEQHDQASHHQVQLKVLKAVYARKPDLVVGIEMVSLDLQKNLDDYLAGRTSDADFEKFWKQAWGFPYELYRPILEYCRTNHIPIKGLNAPIGVIRQIARGGLSSLTPDQRRWLPAQVSQTADPKYMAYLEKSLEGHGPMTPDQRARMLEAMASWNETMGQAAANIAAEHPLLVLAGAGHMAYGKGIMESFSRRSGAAQSVVLPYPPEGGTQPLDDLLKTLRDPKSGEAELADHFWLLPKD